MKVISKHWKAVIFAIVFWYWRGNNSLGNFVNDVIADKNDVTKIMSNSTGFSTLDITALTNFIGKMVITLLLMVGV